MNFPSSLSFTFFPTSSCNAMSFPFFDGISLPKTSLPGFPSTAGFFSTSTSPFLHMYIFLLATGSTLFLSKVESSMIPSFGNLYSTFASTGSVGCIPLATITGLNITSSFIILSISSSIIPKTTPSSCRTSMNSSKRGIFLSIPGIIVAYTSMPSSDIFTFILGWACFSSSSSIISSSGKYSSFISSMFISLTSISSIGVIFAIRPFSGSKVISTCITLYHVTPYLFSISLSNSSRFLPFISSMRMANLLFDYKFNIF